MRRRRKRLNEEGEEEEEGRESGPPFLIRVLFIPRFLSFLPQSLFFFKLSPTEQEGKLW